MILSFFHKKDKSFSKSNFSLIFISPLKNKFKIFKTLDFPTSLDPENIFLQYADEASTMYADIVQNNMDADMMLAMFDSMDPAMQGTIVDTMIGAASKEAFADKINSLL